MGHSPIYAAQRDQSESAARRDRSASCATAPLSAAAQVTRRIQLNRRIEFEPVNKLAESPTWEIEVYIYLYMCIYIYIHIHILIYEYDILI